MRKSNLARIAGYVRAYGQWLLNTAERALEQAYDATLTIKAIEDEHFGGQKISAEANRYTANVQARFDGQLQRCLATAYVRLAEFRTSSLFLDLSARRANTTTETGEPLQRGSRVERELAVLEKLRFIDEVLARYTPQREVPGNSSTALTVIPQNSRLDDASVDLRRSIANSGDAAPNNGSLPASTLTDKTGVLPRSILSTFGRIKKELDPKSEFEVVQDFRSSRNKTVISLRFLLLLILIPLLTQQISKNFLVGPIVDQVRAQSHAPVFLNLELEENALHELQVFEEHLRFEALLRQAPPLSTEALEEKVREKATELAAEYNERSSDSVKNVFADLFALAAFAVVLITRRRDVEILKAFIDEIVYGLSDSAKAFIIILLTDVFVGFHSPHGWEVILEGLSRHLGLPENRQFIFLFIATFPVILDTIFKYWIFRYLNRISPSAVATYRNMNE